jgi:hypothetical protein
MALRLPAPAAAWRELAVSRSTRRRAPKSASATGAALGIQSLDALMALQGVEDSAERRRRFAKRGSSALDLLDALKVEISKAGSAWRRCGGSK